MGELVSTTWWLDESALPSLIWARLRRDGPAAQVRTCDGETRLFETLGEAEAWLSQDEYVPFDELLADGELPEGTLPPA